jgi:PAS domain S-box-containing protein
MTLPAVPSDDAARLALLHTARLLDAEPPASLAGALQANIRLWRTLLGCQAAAINLIDAHRVWSLVQSGFEVRQMARVLSLCEQVRQSQAPHAVTHLDPNTAQSYAAMIIGDQAPQAYLGMPLLVDGQVVGTLCALHTTPHQWDAHAMQAAQDLATNTSALLAAQWREQRQMLSEERMRAASLAGSDWLWETDAQGNLTWVSAGLLRHTGLDPSSEVGLKGAMIYTPRDDDTRESWERFLRARQRREPFSDAIGTRLTPRGPITVSVSGNPYFGPDGAYQGYRGATRIITRQIEAEQDARRSDQLLRDAIDAFNISVMISDPAGQVVFANQRWLAQVGEAHAAGKSLWPDTLARMIHAGHYPDARGREDDYLQWRLNLHTFSEPQEVRLRDTWLLVKDHKLPDHSIVHFAMDITQSKQDDAERQLAAEKLRVSEELYRSVAANISDGLLIFELSGRVVAMNSAANRILGVPASDLQNLKSPGLLGLTLLEDDLVTPVPLPEWAISRTLATGERVVDDVRAVRRPDGDIVWLKMSTQLLKVDQHAPPFAAMATLRDISLARHAQQELQLSEERWKFALEGAGDGVWDWDLLTDRVYYSQRWKAMLGHADHEIGNTPGEFIERLHPDDRQPIIDSVNAHVTSGEGIQQLECRLRHKAGHYLSILSRGKVVSRDRDGQALRVVGTQSDVTHLKQAEQALRAKQLAEAASAAKSEFLSRMSHEIRTPLNAVYGFAQLLQLQAQLDPASATGPSLNYIEQILHASLHLTGLVNDVLDLQQVEAGAVTLKLETVSLADELRQCLAMLAPLALNNRISLDNHVEGAWYARADKQRLRQVIMNIGSNAIKYNTAGGHARFWAEALPDGQVMLTIEDSGPGMSPTQLTKLFQPFERLGRETSFIEGTGLGLIITRSLIEAMGGHMDISSQLGAGTRVNIALSSSSAPADAAPASPARAPMSPASSACPTIADLCDTSSSRSGAISDSSANQGHAGGSALHVLYVEDNRINALLFEEALRPYAQIELCVAEDGQVALDMVRERAPDVLVLDAHLPGMTGFEVLEAMRRLPGLAHTPAFMCSADAMPEDVARAKAAGFTGYWTKPIDIRAVTEALCGLASRGDNAAP